LRFNSTFVYYAIDSVRQKSEKASKHYD
jgi:hypothetical protein